MNDMSHDYVMIIFKNNVFVGGAGSEGGRNYGLGCLILTLQENSLFYCWSESNSETNDMSHDYFMII